MDAAYFLTPIAISLGALVISVATFALTIWRDREARILRMAEQRISTINAYDELILSQYKVEWMHRRLAEYPLFTYPPDYHLSQADLAKKVGYRFRRLQRRVNRLHPKPNWSTEKAVLLAELSHDVAYLRGFAKSQCDDADTVMMLIDEASGAAPAVARPRPLVHR